MQTGSKITVDQKDILALHPLDAPLGCQPGVKATHAFLIQLMPVKT